MTSVGRTLRMLSIKLRRSLPLSGLRRLSDRTMENEGRRLSTVDDEQRVVALLKDLIAFRESTVSSWILENKVKTLVQYYKCLEKEHQQGFLKVLAAEHSVDHQRIYNALNQFKELTPDSAVFLKAEEQLRTVLTPHYSWLFKLIGRLEAGVKFLVDLRTDVLNTVKDLDPSTSHYVPLQQLNASLKDLLSLWFSVGFLNLERVTWKSPCEMLQKISEYEAVHPVRSWSDLKRRVGSYRRCYVYTHGSMPCEPIVVLHTALCTEIASSTKGIIAATQRMSVDASSMGGIVNTRIEDEDTSSVTTAIFYSISSTQPGLQGIELGNYLIKQVVREIQTEIPNVTQFSSLSPIPTFRSWLIDRLKLEPAIGGEVWAQAKEVSGGWPQLFSHLSNNSWLSDPALVAALEKPLLTCCAHYLYKEKRRGLALDSVANFHLRNGAVMWRLNWLADSSPRGLSNSFGLMVNYRYFLEDTENNSRNYLENKCINASDQVTRLIDSDNLTAKM